MKLFEYSHTKLNTDYYKPKKDVYIKAISFDGDIAYKKILQYTVHHNLVMYKVIDTKNRFKPFYVSDDLSMIVLDKEEGIIKVSPKRILEEPDKLSNRKLIQNAWDDKFMLSTFIPLDEVKIFHAPQHTTAYDFTVEDFYTFSTSDGVFLMDTCALYRPLTEEAKKEVREKMMFSNNNFVNASDGIIYFKASQDIVLGLYKISRNPEEKKKFEKRFGVEIKEELTKNNIHKFFQNILESKQNGVDLMNDIIKYSYEYITLHPTSISLDRFWYDGILEEKEVLKSIDSNKKSREKEQEILEKFKEVCKIKDIIESGSRGTWDQLRQISIRRGYITDEFGNILNVPVNTSYVEGLNEKEIFLSARGTRKGLIDTAENVAKSGYMTRQLVYVQSENYINEDVEDCGTERLIKIYIDDSIINSFKGRYVKNTRGKLVKVKESIVKSHIFEDKEGKYIMVRSPLTCKCKDGLCKKCIGDFYHGKSSYSKNIGIIAAQTLGELTTQLLLRTFHFSGSASLNEDKDTFSKFKFVKKLFETNSEGVYNINDVYKNHLEPLKSVYMDFNKNMKFLILELILSGLMFTKNKKKFRLENENEYVLFNNILSQSLNAPFYSISFGYFKKALINMLQNPEINRNNPFFNVFFRHMVK